jgi:hypothetical protein
MVRNYNEHRSKTTHFRISPLVNSKDGIDFAMLFTLKTTRKAGGLQILRCQGIAVGNYSFTLDALTLKPSGFCNVGVYYVDGVWGGLNRFRQFRTVLDSRDA